MDKCFRIVLPMQNITLNHMLNRCKCNIGSKKKVTPLCEKIRKQNISTFFIKNLSPQITLWRNCSPVSSVGICLYCLQMGYIYTTCGIGGIGKIKFGLEVKIQKGIRIREVHQRRASTTFNSTEPFHFQGNCWCSVW